MMNEIEGELPTLQLAAEITSAWLGNPNTRTSADDVPAFLRSIHAALEQLRAGPARSDEPAKQAEQPPVPAVSIRKSLADPKVIISLIDGRPYRTLKKHLARHGMTPEQYRARFGLPATYPVVAPAYSETRRAMAKKIGLGTRANRGEDTGAPA